jgi:anthranilate phosphoribosyltransferase
MSQALRSTLEQLLRRQDLSEVQAGELLEALTEPEIAPALAGALLAALRSKGVTADEVRGFAGAMRRLARRPRLWPEHPWSMSWARVVMAREV